MSVTANDQNSPSSTPITNTTVADTPMVDKTVEVTAQVADESSMPIAVNKPETQAPPDEAKERKKQKSRAANRAAVQLLCDTYPQAFSLTSLQPLKIGIQQELADDGKISQTKIKRGLASYVRQFAYLRSQKVGAVRVNRLGEPSGEVTADEAQHAQSKLPARTPHRPSEQALKTNKRPEKNHKKEKLATSNGQGKHNNQGTANQHRKPNSPQASHSSKKSPAKQKNKTKAETASSPFTGMDDSQRFASKLDLLLNKNK